MMRHCYSVELPRVDSLAGRLARRVRHYVERPLHMARAPPATRHVRRLLRVTPSSRKRRDALFAHNANEVVRYLKDTIVM